MGKEIFIAIRKILVTVAALASVSSGWFWFLSAKAQMTIIDFISEHPNETNKIAKLNYLSLTENYWAAYAAAVAGVAIGLTLFFDI